MSALLIIAAATASPPMSGDWDCAAEIIVAATLTTQNGSSFIDEARPEDFRYGDFTFSYDDQAVLVGMRNGEERVEERVPYFRQAGYLTFTFNLGLTGRGGANPITFWTNEAGQEKARYQVSFPIASMRTMTTLSGAEVHLGDAAMAVAALSCLKRSAA